MGDEGTRRRDQQEAGAAARVSPAGKEADSNAGKTVAMDVGFKQTVKERIWGLMKAWEEEEDAKDANESFIFFSALEARRKARKAAFEADLKRMEERFERERAGYEEEMKNKLALLHKEARENRGMLIEAARAEEFRQIEEAAAKFPATNMIRMKKPCTFCGQCL